LKLWQRSEDEVCNDKLVIRDEDYLLEGLEFNRKFAKDVYLGIAPVTLSEDTKKIRRGRLIETPKKDELEERVKYALIMRRLNEHWRLDYHLCQNRLGRDVSIDFIAKEVAQMHRHLENSPGNYGAPDRISLKLDLNKELFLEALGRLSNGENNLEKYGWISNLVARVCKDYTELFRQRYNDGHIKRCHGDLKATNLWVRPAKTLFFGLKKYPQQLLALDCIDFNPEFCHIDTLSDVAMLAVDIEMHVTRWTGAYKDMEYAQNFANVFLDRYLREMKEDSIDTWPLLRYYMTEKAMVCAYVSILYDGQPELGQRYLDIAYIHAQQLGRPIEAPAKARASVVS
jgi:aminoglycoside phosphotransferase family enzyme